MDKLARALRDDAECIEIHVPTDLDERLRASIENAPSPATGRKPARNPATRIGWASALTGVAVVAGIILVVNIERTEAPTSVIPPLESVTGALPRLNAETAVLTAPLTEELENLEADLRKAEQAVRREIGLDM